RPRRSPRKYRGIRCALVMPGQRLSPTCRVIASSSTPGTSRPRWSRATCARQIGGRKTATRAWGSNAGQRSRRLGGASNRQLSEVLEAWPDAYFTPGYDPKQPLPTRLCLTSLSVGDADARLCNAAACIFFLGVRAMLENELPTLYVCEFTPNNKVAFE